MRLPKYFVLAAIAGVTLIASGVVLGLVSNAWTVYPTDDTKSKFLTDFNLTDVLNRYVTIRQSGVGKTDAAGFRYPWKHKSVSHSVELLWIFPPDPLRYRAMMAALLAEVRDSLAAADAEITFQDVAEGRFTILYRSGRATGSIRTEAPKGDVLIYGPASSSIWDRLTVRIEEEWSVTG